MICHNCGKEFEDHKRKFCETKCSKRYHNRKANGCDLSVYEVEPPIYNKPVYINCESCGTKFRRKKNGGKSGGEYTKFCSVSCGVKYYYNSGEGAKARLEKNRVLFVAKEVAGIKKLKKNVDNRNKRIINKAYTYARHNYCRTCGNGIVQQSKQMCVRYCDDCKESRRIAKKVARDTARQEGRIPSGSDRARAKFYGVAYEPVKRKVVFDKAGWKCEFCGEDTPKELKGKNEDNSPELDHIYPISKGGGHIYDNVQLLCRACNAAKSDMAQCEFINTPYGGRMNKRKCAKEPLQKVIFLRGSFSSLGFKNCYVNG